MKNARLYGSVVLFLLAVTTSANAQVLYGAEPGSNSPLYVIDQSTGSATTIGNIGFGVGALAQDPITGILYGVTAQAPAASTLRALIRIDPSSGAGTLIGNIGLGVGGIADIAFRSDGTLFGWSENTDDLITINLSTGAGTVVGNAGVSTRGSGLTFNSGGTLYLAGNNANGALRTVNTATGITTIVATLNGAPAPANFPIPAMKFLPDTNVIYAINRTSLGAGATGRLITINPTTGAITVIGPTVPRLDALTFFRPRGGTPPSLTEVIPSSGSTLGGTQVTLRGSDFNADRRPQVTFDGIAASNVVVVNSSTITALTPAHAAGAVDVAVLNNDGQRGTLRSSFTYVVTTAATPVTLTVQLSGHGVGRVASAPAGIACGADCTETYAAGSAVSVQLTAIPAADAVFGGWTGDADCGDGVVTMTGNRTCAARFERLPDGQPLDLDGDGRGDLVAYAPVAGPALSGGAITALLTHPGVLRGGDLNGDRRSDLFSYDPATGAWSMDLGGANVVTAAAAPRQSPLVMDVNGDGRAEVVFHDPIAGRVQPCVASIDGLDCRATAAVAVGAVVLPFDLNGDGRGDLLTYRWATGAIGFLLGTTGGTFDGSDQTLAVAADRQVLVLDVNGDRRSDLIVADPVGGDVTLMLNTGSGFTPQGLGSAPGFTLHAAKLDGDARADLIAYDAATGQTVQALNTGSGFTVVSSLLPAGRHTTLTDLDGDLRADLVLYDPTTGAFTLAFSQANGTFTQQHGTAPAGLTIVAQQSVP